MIADLPISFCMIVKNEEVFLDVALKSVTSVFGADDIVVVDTGSTDQTKAIASENGASVFDFTWIDDFSAARNFAASKAENDWIFVIDADEEVAGADLSDIQSFIPSIQNIGMVSLVDTNTKRASTVARLYNRSVYSFKGNIHEQIRAIDESAKPIYKEVNISMLHHGYLPEYDKVNAKLERNERLLLAELKKQPENPYLLYQLGKSYFCNDRNLSKACEYFEKAMRAGADVNVNYTYDLVECYAYALLNTAHYEKALALREKFFPYYKDNVQFRFLSGHIFQNNGMFIEAVESYESCIGMDVFNPNGLTSFLSFYNIGVILECIGMIEDALEMYKSCGDYAPAVQRLVELGADGRWQMTKDK